MLILSAKARNREREEMSAMREQLAVLRKAYRSLEDEHTRLVLACGLKGFRIEIVPAQPQRTILKSAK
jgi:hypothetical protein